MTVGPCELFGFGIADFPQGPIDAAKQEMLGYVLSSDVTLIAGFTGKNVKVLAPLASAVFHCERHEGIPGTGLPSHKLTPSVGREGAILFHRYKVEPRRRCVRARAQRIGGAG